MKIGYNIIVIVLTTSLILCMCKDEEKNINEEGKKIIFQTVAPLLSDILGDDIDSLTWVHFEFYPENAKEMPLKKFLEISTDSLDGQMLELAQMLLKQVQDSVKIEFVPDYEFSVGNRIVEERFMKLNPETDLVGRISISNPVISDGDTACYYFAYLCPPVIEGECGMGFLVFVNRNKETWKLFKYFPLWRDAIED